MKKNLVGLLALFALSAALSACGGSNESGGSGNSHSTSYCKYTGDLIFEAIYSDSQDRTEFEKQMKQLCEDQLNGTIVSEVTNLIGTCEVPTSVAFGTTSFDKSKLSAKVHFPKSVSAADAKALCENHLRGKFTEK